MNPMILKENSGEKYIKIETMNVYDFGLWVCLLWQSSEASLTSRPSFFSARNNNTTTIHHLLDINHYQLLVFTLVVFQNIICVLSSYKKYFSFLYSFLYFTIGGGGGNGYERWQRWWTVTMTMNNGSVASRQ